MQSDPVRRLPSGAIDYEFYHRRAAFIRSDVITSAFKERPDVLRLLAAASVALALTWLSHTPTGTADGKDTEASRARFVCTPHLTAPAFAQHHDEGHHAAC